MMMDFSGLQLDIWYTVMVLDTISPWQPLAAGFMWKPLETT